MMHQNWSISAHWEMTMVSSYCIIVCFWSAGVQEIRIDTGHKKAGRYLPAL